MIQCCLTTSPGIQWSTHTVSGPLHTARRRDTYSVGPPSYSYDPEEVTRRWDASMVPASRRRRYIHSVGPSSFSQATRRRTYTGQDASSVPASNWVSRCSPCLHQMFDSVKGRTYTEGSPSEQTAIHGSLAYLVSGPSRTGGSNSHGAAGKQLTGNA